MCEKETVKTLYCKVKEFNDDRELIDLTFDNEDVTRVANYTELMLGVNGGHSELMDDNEDMIEYIKLDDGIYKWIEKWEYDEDFDEDILLDCDYIRVDDENDE